MNAFPLLPAQPWVERLGSTLLHFVWQGAAIAGVYAATRRWMARDASPEVRYLLACAALVTMAVAPVLTWSVVGMPAPDNAAVSLSAHASAAASTGVGYAPASFLTTANPAAAAPVLPWVVAAWLAGAMVFWLRLFGAWILAERLRLRLVRPAPAEWQETLDRLKARIRVSRPVRLLVSSLVQTPAVVGWLRPVVLVPVGVLAGLPAAQVEALLLHELAHIRRHDYGVNVLQSVVEALLFYHPAVWWISGHIRAERELCCDDEAVFASGDAICYARALAELGAVSRAHSRTVMAAAAGSLAHRIARLLGQSRPIPRTLSGPGIAGITVILAMTIVAVFGQPGTQPQFEVASIKPSDGQGFQTVRPLAGRLTADATVRRLMQYAYSLQPYQIAGGPDWAGSERFEIDAKAGVAAGRAQLFLMLQSLLEERFQLKIRRETRELPVYTLVATRNGPKLPSPKEGACVEPGPDTPSEWAGGRIQPPLHREAPVGACGVASVRLQFEGARMQGGNLSMGELVRGLSLVLGRTVVDKTGYAERFDLRLDFEPDETTSALPPPPPNAAATPADSRNPSILIALQQQLGLRLEPAKGPVEVVFIEHVERPTAN